MQSKIPHLLIIFILIFINSYSQKYVKYFLLDIYYPNNGFQNVITSYFILDIINKNLVIFCGNQINGLYWTTPIRDH